jgi:regulatory protein
MRSHRSRPLASEEDLYQYALRALVRRAHSVFEMRRALERRAEKALVRRVLSRLTQGGLLDDARYARQFARYRAESRRQGRFRVARELRARGVADRLIEAALDDVFAEVDESATLRRRIERRLKQLRGRNTRAPLDQRKLASLYSSLLRAGFSGEAIRRELRQLTRHDVETLAEREEEGTADERG